MNLRELLDAAQLNRTDDWVLIPGNRPATAMVAGVFDAGFKEAQTRPLAGHSIAIYEPNPALSMVWPVPEDDEEADRRRQRLHPEWDQREEFKHIRPGYAVLMLGGAPIWQTLVWYLDWGSGIGGYVADFSAIFDRDAEERPAPIIGWEASSWDIGLAGLINSFAHAAHEWFAHDPTDQVVTKRSEAHPLAVARGAD
jgi:hypothetical protein